MPSEQVPTSRRFSDSEVFGRLSRLEGAFETVIQRLDSLDRKLERRGFETRTQWGPIIGGVAVIISIVGIFGAGYTKDQNRLEGSVHNLSQEFAGHIHDGHPKWVSEKIDAVKLRVDDHRDQIRTIARELTEHEILSAREHAEYIRDKE